MILYVSSARAIGYLPKGGDAYIPLSLPVKPQRFMRIGVDPQMVVTKKTPDTKKPEPKKPEPKKPEPKKPESKKMEPKKSEAKKVIAAKPATKPVSKTKK